MIVVDDEAPMPHFRGATDARQPTAFSVGDAAHTLLALPAWEGLIWAAVRSGRRRRGLSAAQDYAAYEAEARRLCEGLALDPTRVDALWSAWLLEADTDATWALLEAWRLV